LPPEVFRLIFATHFCNHNVSQDAALFRLEAKFDALFLAASAELHPMKYEISNNYSKLASSVPQENELMTKRIVGIGFVWLLICLSCSTRGRPLIEAIAQFDTAGWAHDVIPEGRLLCIADRQGGFAVFDRDRGWTSPIVAKPVADVISLAPNSGAPMLAARYEGLVRVSDGKIQGRIVLGDIANAVATRGDLVFGAYGANGLVIGRSGKAEMQLVSSLKTPGWSHDVKLWGNRALLADWTYGLRVVDVSRPEQPAEIGVLPTRSTAICIAIEEAHGKTIAAVAEGHAGVSLVSFDVRGRPERIGGHALGLRASDTPHPEAGGWAHGVALCGDYLFVANWKRGLAVLDIRDPRNPILIAEAPTRGTSLGVKAEAEPDRSILVFLADGEEGLRVLRVNAGVR
jgi:hypothetical protein